MGKRGESSAREKLSREAGELALSNLRPGGSSRREPRASSLSEAPRPAPPPKPKTSPSESGRHISGDTETEMREGQEETGAASAWAVARRRAKMREPYFGECDMRTGLSIIAAFLNGRTATILAPPRGKSPSF